MADTFTHDNENFIYNGRFITRASGQQPGWSSSQIRFKVAGTTTIKVFVDLVCPVDTDVWTVVILVDDLEKVTSSFIIDEEIFSGERSVTLTLPDSGEHEVILRMSGVYGSYTRVFDADTYKMIFAKIEVDDNATISRHPLAGDLRTICFGDSWMADNLDWTRHLDPSIFGMYPVASGAVRATVMDSNILFRYDGVFMSDEHADIIIINSSVNDKIASVSTASFNTSMTSVIAKLKARFPEVPIFLVQSPDYDVTWDYSIYGPEMSAIADANDDVYYVPIAGIGELTWNDSAHLADAGRRTMAAWVGDSIETQMQTGIIDHVSVGGDVGYIAPTRQVEGGTTTIYRGSTGFSFKLVNGSLASAPTPDKMVGYVSGG